MSSQTLSSIRSYLVGKTFDASEIAALSNGTYPGTLTFDLQNDYFGSTLYSVDQGYLPNDPNYVVAWTISAGSTSTSIKITQLNGNGTTSTASADIVGFNGSQILLQSGVGSYNILSLAPLTNTLDADWNNGVDYTLSYATTGSFDTTAVPQATVGEVVGQLAGLKIPELLYANSVYTGYVASATVSVSNGVYTATAESVDYKGTRGNPHVDVALTLTDASGNPLTNTQVANGNIYVHIDQATGHTPYAVWSVLGWQNNLPTGGSAILLGQSPSGVAPYTVFQILYSSPQTSQPTTQALGQTITFQSPPGAIPFDPPCFAAGTRIRTVSGDVAVEDLAVGDTVLTLQDGEPATRPVVWIGSRHVDLTAHPTPYTAQPIRIRRDAFGEGLPGADLVVSPDHALFVDGMLIAARLLVNGATIVEDTVCRAVHYFHVELDQHAVLFAEGLPAESYLDTGNRAAFENAQTPIALRPDFSLERRLLSRAAASCAPFVVDAAMVKPVWDRLVARATALGFAAPAVIPTSDDPALTVSVMGQTIQPVRVAGDRYSFILPAGAERVTLVSRTTRPAATAPWIDDRRDLGVSVGRITLHQADNAVQDIAIDHPGLTDGWWAVERNATRLWRWTNGRAELDLTVGAAHPRVLEIRLAGTIAYPAAQELSQAA